MWHNRLIKVNGNFGNEGKRGERKTERRKREMRNGNGKRRGPAAVSRRQRRW